MLSLNCSERNTYDKNTFRTEECTECAWYVIENNDENKKQYFL